MAIQFLAGGRRAPSRVNRVESKSLRQLAEAAWGVLPRAAPIRIIDLAAPPPHLFEHPALSPY
ncbi:MAG: hypothetical protein V3W34_20365 [Phycisphaerae bacterium]